jgi:phospholipase C
VLEKNDVIEGIHQSKFKNNPSGYKALTKIEIEEIRNTPSKPLMPKQESGTRPANALPYELYADGKLNGEKNLFELHLKTGDKIYGNASAGSPFHVYANNNKDPRAYAVKAGDQLSDSWKLTDFENNVYRLMVYGPNGFYREFNGNDNNPNIEIQCNYEMKNGSPSGNIELIINNKSDRSIKVDVADQSYKQKKLQRSIHAGRKENIIHNLNDSRGWYDFTVTLESNTSFMNRYAGRVENGKETITDPLMGSTST